MKHNYDDYDFETFFADVFDNYNYADDGIRIRSREDTYDSYTGRSDDWNYYWN